MLGLFLTIYVDIIMGPTVDAILEGLFIGMSANILNNGELLWSMEE